MILITNPLEKSRLINYGKGATNAKEGRIARLQQDFAKHFCDSIDYEPNAKVNGVCQPLIVSQDKDVLNVRKLYAYPGQTFYTGDVVDCYDSKWLITEVDQNKEIYTWGKMQQCNRELIWQNTQTGEIISRWVTAEKPYYSNLNETQILTVSNREYKVQVAYDDETSQIDLDKRFMLELVAGKPRTYKVTSVDTITERFYEGGTTRGFLVLNLAQDLYNPNTDNADLMICDYVDPNVLDFPGLTGKARVEITYSGAAQIRYGGSAKRFTACYYENDSLSEDFTSQWSIHLSDGFADMLESTIDGNTIWLRALDDVRIQGQVVTLSVDVESAHFDLEIEVV